MVGVADDGGAYLGRMRILDAKPVNLDGFSMPNPDLGLVAMRSPHDPEPSLVLRDGQVIEMDGKAAADFDVIDEFIARYGLDLERRGRGHVDVRRRAGPQDRRPQRARAPRWSG